MGLYKSLKVSFIDTQYSLVKQSDEDGKHFETRVYYQLKIGLRNTLRL